MTGETKASTNTGHEKYNVVYENATPETYDQWAKDQYDEEIVEFARPGIESVSAKCLQHLGAQNRTGIVKGFDAGCGTGAVAQVCRQELEKQQAKFTYEWHGLDFSEGMLEQARKKVGLFEDLKQGDLKKELDYASETFDLIVSAGTFLQGHVGSEALPELCRILKPNGLMIFTVRPTFFEETKDSWMEGLAKGGMTVLGIDTMPYAKGMDAPVLSCVKGPLEMKVSNKKSAGFYIRAGIAFFKGTEAQEAKEGRDAAPARAPVDELKISGLGEAVNIAVTTSARLEADGLATVSSLVTDYPEMSNGSRCAQIAITMQRKM